MCIIYIVLYLSELMQEPTIGMTALWCPNPETRLRAAVVSEHPQPALFLQGNELLLTATAGGEKDYLAWDKYIEHLQNRRIAALGVGLGETLTTVPAELLAACRKWGMNLFEIKDAGTFALISKTVAKLTRENQRQGEIRLLNLQQQLIKSTTQANPLPILLKVLAQSIQAHIGLYTDKGREISQVLPAAIPEKFKQVISALPPVNSALNSWHQEYENCVVIGQKLSVISGQSYYLRAVFMLSPASWHLTALNQAGLIIGAALMNQLRLRGNQYQLLERAWELLYTGEEKAGKILVEIVYPQTRILQGGFHPVCVSGEKGELLAYREKMLTQDYSITPPIPFRLTPTYLEMLVPTGALPLTLSYLGKGEYGSLRAGVGQECDLSNLAPGVKESRAALKHTDVAYPVRHWKDIVASGFFSVFSPGEIESYAHMLLQPLQHDQELIRILKIFINANGNRLEIASKLGLHRNTVTGRIQKIQRALKMNLDDPGVRAQLWIALKSQETITGNNTSSSESFTN